MSEIPEEQIHPLLIGGLHGRLLKVPTSAGKGDKPILLLYGLHSSLERMYSNAQFLSRYGNVWMPDLPGFGGMDSLYKVERQPDLDAYADYLYTFFKTYKMDQKKLTVVAMSFGFLILTRMFQKYPETQKNVKVLISFVGFGRSSDFNYSPIKNPSTRLIMNIGASKTGSKLIRGLVFNPLSLRLMFQIFRLFNPKYSTKDKTERRANTKMELDLWQKNDTRTRFAVYRLFGDFDLTKNSEQIKLSVHDMYTDGDQYFDTKKVNKTLAKLYKSSTSAKAIMELHAPSIIGTEEEVSRIFPASIKKLLAK